MELDNSINYTNQRYGRSKLHPKKFALLIACVSMVMLFLAFTSAYVVRQAAGNWLEFALPSWFNYSAVIIIASSLALHASYLLFKREQFLGYRVLLVLATLLGIAFIACQYQGWVELRESGVLLNGNVSGSFIYAISGTHAAHVVGGIGVLLVALVHAFGLPNKVTALRKLRFELSLIYWHFMDFLWLYLLGFLYLI